MLMEATTRIELVYTVLQSHNEQALSAPDFKKCL